MNFGGLGAFGMFAALIAVCALAFSVTDASEKKNDWTADHTWTVEAPAMPLIVSNVDPLAPASALNSDGLTFTVASVVQTDEFRSLQRHQKRRKGVSATVLLLHRYALKSDNRDSLGLRRNRHNRHRMM